jgi:hypothetical protein
MTVSVLVRPLQPKMLRIRSAGYWAPRSPQGTAFPTERRILPRPVIPLLKQHPIVGRFKTRSFQEFCVHPFAMPLASVTVTSRSRPPRRPPLHSPALGAPPILAFPRVRHITGRGVLIEDRRHQGNEQRRRQHPPARGRSNFCHLLSLRARSYLMIGPKRRPVCAPSRPICGTIDHGQRQERWEDLRLRVSEWFHVSA